MANARKTDDKIKRARAKAERELAKARAKTERKVVKAKAALADREAEIRAALERKITAARAKLKPSARSQKKAGSSPSRNRKRPAGAAGEERIARARIYKCNVRGALREIESCKGADMTLRRQLLTSTSALLDQLPGVRDGGVEAIHDARVATRRIRALLPVLSVCYPQTDLKRTAGTIKKAGRALGRVRDLDVAIELITELERTSPAAAGRAAEVRHLIAAKQLTARRRLVKKFDDLPLGAVMSAAVQLPKNRWHVVRAGMQECDGPIRDALRDHAAALRHAIDHGSGVYFPKRAHAVRIDAKKLRYILEMTNDPEAIAAGGLKTLKKAQEILGACTITRSSKSVSHGWLTRTKTTRAWRRCWPPSRRNAIGFLRHTSQADGAPGRLRCRRALCGLDRPARRPACGAAANRIGCPSGGRAPGGSGRGAAPAWSKRDAPRTLNRAIMDFSRVPTFAGDGSFHVVVESPRGATVKLKFDPVLHAFAWGRPLTSGLSYPFDWGFIAGYHASDGDPLDAMVLWEGSTYPGVIIACRALGLVMVEQDKKEGSGRERNDRIISVPSVAPRWEDRQDLTELSPRSLDELAAFFLQVTLFENKRAVVLGFDGVAAARSLIEESARRRPN